MRKHTTRSHAFGALLMLLLSVPAVQAQGVTDSAAYIVRLGTDTIGVERWIRNATTLEAVRVSRTPRTSVQRFTMRFGADGAVTHFAQDDKPLVATASGTIPLAPGFYAPYAVAFAAASRARDTLVAVPMRAGEATQNLRARRIGADAFELINPAGAVTMRARLTRDGGLLWLDVGSSTTVERVHWFDIDRVTREFTARDERGAGLGAVSPIDTARARSAGANIIVVYSRPSARGRTIFGGLVPYDRTWRTGANSATELIIDKPASIGGLRLEAGRYALLTVPGRNSWQLIVNRQTGMAGAMSNDPVQEVGRVQMSARVLPQHVERFKIDLDATRDGAVLRMQWETTEAFIPIVVEARP